MTHLLPKLFGRDDENEGSGYLPIVSALMI